jgi:hypothetical protein
VLYLLSSRKKSLQERDYTPFPPSFFPTLSNTFTLTGFSNPENAKQTVLNHIRSATISFYAEIYSMGISDITNAFKDLKNSQPSKTLYNLKTNTYL